jgi:uncharacterized membrane protein SirB2
MEYYLEARWVHISAVLASGLLFAVRGLAVLLQAGWPMAPLLRYLSYAIDTLLLAAGIFLVSMLPAAVFGNGWLYLKLALLVVYIVLGSLALKRGRTPNTRLISYVFALLVFMWMYFVARTHHPLGPLLILRHAMAQ